MTLLLLIDERLAPLELFDECSLKVFSLTVLKYFSDDNFFDSFTCGLRLPGPRVLSVVAKIVSRLAEMPTDASFLLSPSVILNFDNFREKRQRERTQLNFLGDHLNNSQCRGE